MVQLPELDELKLMNSEDLRLLFSRLDGEFPLSSAEADLWFFRVEKLYRQSCYQGDIKVVKLLLSGLPRRFDFLSERLMERGYGVVCAAYGHQVDVIDFAFGVMSAQHIFGEDWDLVLQVLADDPGVYARASDPDELYLSDSVMRSLLGIASSRGFYDFIGILKKHAEAALDEEIERQMFHLDSLENS